MQPSVAAFTPLDWLALALYGAGWAGYSLVVDRVPSVHRRSVIAAMDGHRRRWMRALTLRDNRIFDSNIIGSLMASTGFLANTSIFILGGLVAMMGSPDLGRRVFGALQVTTATASDAAWEARILLLLVVFVSAFFELTWALRQFNYCLIVIGGIPQPMQPADPAHQTQADMAAEVANRAARHFNSGLRAYYFGLAALAWLIHPLALMAATLLVVRELYRREFRSLARAALTAGEGGDQR